MGEPPRYSWTQPCCQQCWYDRNTKDPVVLVEAYREEEACVHCGKACKDGIYIRIDPAEAPHPTRLKD